MFENYWYPFIQAKDVKNKPKRLVRFGTPLVVWRDVKGEIHCFLDRCPHRGAALSQGRLTENCIECPYHGFRFDAEGRCTLMPASGCDAKISKSFRLRKYETIEDHGLVWIWWGESRESLPPLPWPPDMQPTALPPRIGGRVVPVPFGRFIESLLDCHHFYFVHKSIKIPGIGPLAKEFACDVDDEIITIRGAFCQDNAEGRKGPGAAFRVTMRFPNVIDQDFTKLLRGVIVCCPVDDGHTWTALIHLWNHSFFGLGRFISWWFMRKSLQVALDEDIRIQKLQIPVTSGYLHDRLVSRADQGIVELLKIWGRKLSEGTSSDITFAQSDISDEQELLPDLANFDGHRKTRAGAKIDAFVGTEKF